MKWLLILLLLSTIALAECIEPSDGMIIKQNVLFCSSTYDVPNGITIAADSIVVDCGTAILRGIVGESEIGVRIENVDGVTLRNCNIITFTQGLYLKNVTNSLIEKNAFLKNRIGVRMLNAYENVLRDNNDKSHQVAVSAIDSKYNVVMLGNKDIERAFCEVNACNEYRDMNVCEPGDFYCSKKCTPQSDADCAPPVAKIEPPKEPEKTAEDIIEKAEKEVLLEKSNNQTHAKETKLEKKKLSFGNKILIYAALYAITFLVLRVLKRRR